MWIGCLQRNGCPLIGPLGKHPQRVGIGSSADLCGCREQRQAFLGEDRVLVLPGADEMLVQLLGIQRIAQVEVVQ